MNGISAKQWVVFIIDHGIHRVLLVIGEEQKITICAAADTGISPGLQVEQGLAFHFQCHLMNHIQVIKSVCRHGGTEYHHLSLATRLDKPGCFAFL